MAVHSHNFVTTPEHPSFQRCITNASGSVKGCGAVQRISDMHVFYAGDSGVTGATGNWVEPSVPEVSTRMRQNGQ
jgi:hypothetical protein